MGVRLDYTILLSFFVYGHIHGTLNFLNAAWFFFSLCLCVVVGGGGCRGLKWSNYFFLFISSVVNLYTDRGCMVHNALCSISSEQIKIKYTEI